MTKPRIMIVEDELVVATDLKLMLQSLGYEVCTIESSAEGALRKTGELIPDLVLMDIGLDGKADGIEAAEEIRSRWSIPVIYISAQAHDRILKRAEKTYPYGYLVKPVNEDNLKSTVRMALHKANSDHQREKEINALKKELARQLMKIGTMNICSECQKILIEKH